MLHAGDVSNLGGSLKFLAGFDPTKPPHGGCLAVFLKRDTVFESWRWPVAATWSQDIVRSERSHRGDLPALWGANALDQH